MKRNFEYRPKPNRSTGDGYSDRYTTLLVVGLATTLYVCWFILLLNNSTSNNVDGQNLAYALRSSIDFAQSHHNAEWAMLPAIGLVAALFTAVKKSKS